MTGKKLTWELPQPVRSNMDDSSQSHSSSSESSSTLSFRSKRRVVSSKASSRVDYYGEQLTFDDHQAAKKLLRAQFRKYREERGHCSCHEHVDSRCKSHDDEEEDEERTSIPEIQWERPAPSVWC